MKKLLFIALLGIVFSCENNEVNKEAVDYKKVSSSLDLTFRNTFQTALNSNTENVYDDTYLYLKGNYFKGNLDINIKAIKENNAAIFSGRISSSDLDLNFLTADQQTLIRPFFDKILLLDDVSTVSDIVSSFNDEVLLSGLNNEQKYQLFTLSSAVKIGSEIISQQVAKAENSGGRAQKVDIKGALQAGVVGLAIGAATGGYAGATGGTVVFPIVGTVTGGVAGAVVGGAIGFVGGVAESILQDLLFN